MADWSENGVRHRIESEGACELKFDVIEEHRLCLVVTMEADGVELRKPWGLEGHGLDDGDFRDVVQAWRTFHVRCVVFVSRQPVCEMSRPVGLGDLRHKAPFWDLFTMILRGAHLDFPFSDACEANRERSIGRLRCVIDRGEVYRTSDFWLKPNWGGSERARRR